MSIVGVVLNTNMAALFATNNLRKSHGQVDSAMERLSSGLRINRAADDAAGLAISETLRSQVNGLGQAQRNAQEGISLLQTADGGLNETHAALQRMRTLAVQAANGTNSSDNLRQIQTEMDQLSKEIDHIADGSEFNGMRLLDGTFHDKLLQIGANAGQTMQVDIYSRRIPPTPAIPEVPAVPPTAAKTALWDVDKGLPAAGSTVSFSQTVGGKTTSVDVPIPDPGPTSVPDLVAVFQANSDFAAAFTARTSSYSVEGPQYFTDVNVIVESQTPGAGAVTVNGIHSSWEQVDPGTPGRPKIPEVPAKEEQFLGYHASEILFGVVDVTKPGGDVTTPGYTYTTGGTTYETGGQNTGFGTGSYIPKTSVTVPKTTVTVPPTTTSHPSGASDAISMIDRAIDIVSRGRGDLGAGQNRLEHTIRNLGVGEENLGASESRIRDADMAKEMVRLTRGQILSQAGTAMLAQANQAPQSILKLLG